MKHGYKRGSSKGRRGTKDREGQMGVAKETRTIVVANETSKARPIF